MLEEVYNERLKKLGKKSEASQKATSTQMKSTQL